ncbi:hypothetical protein F442_19349 [Phytophthora nicotianae P10297]|uniref:HAT C-terminal dimerisation domain-containing protein n=1 Tax=Phytophthora nicotianae P10297 TaxID=1317064 RepID=W2YC83_PHYNI|nr:hypothetical protein F442_19349 [Phytophthora nicotianae P10297]
MDANGFASVPMDAPKRPRGRPPSRAWAFFTTITEPQKQPSTACRHCNQVVHYHKKWAQARAHLMKCPQFLRMIDTLPPSDVPEWYLAEINRRQQIAAPIRSANIPAVFQQNQIPTQTPAPAPATPFKVIQPIPSPVAMATMMPMQTGNENMTVRNGVNMDWQKMEENMAMHMFTTLQMEFLLDEKIELPFLLQTFQAYNANITLPTKEKLMTELLDRCYDNVRTRLLGFFKSGLVPVTLSMDTEDDEVANYMATLASSEKYPMYLESVKVPSGGDADANAEVAARDMTRVVEKISSPVAGCVMPCSTVESRQTRELLEKQFPAMYFHGCMRDALLSFVRQLFAGNKDTHNDRKRPVTVPFAQDLQQFALQCKDLAFFLPHHEQPSYLSGGTSSNMVHVTARRRLTVEEAFVAILQAEPFLDVDNVLNRLGNGSNRAHHPSVAHFQTQLVKIVRSPQFVEKLGKYLELMRPIQSLLSSLNDTTPLLLSEVYSSFSRLVQQFGAMASLQPEEKAALQALVRRQQDHVMGSAHLLAYLLDPVLLGEDLPADIKTETEKKLMASLRGDGTQLSVSDKEALYTQYVDFKKHALNQKTNKADTLAFRALKERKKSPLQFWFADGSKWPVLQAIACRIFVMPVCAPSSARAVKEAGAASSVLRHKKDLLMSDKLTFVRLNSRQLRLAEVEGSSLAALVKKAPIASKANEITASMVV